MLQVKKETKRVGNGFSTQAAMEYTKASVWVDLSGATKLLCSFHAPPVTAHLTFHASPLNFPSIFLEQVDRFIHSRSSHSCSSLGS